MEQLIQSSDLFVMQVEMDVYTALKKVYEKNDISHFQDTLTVQSDLLLKYLCDFLSLQWMFLQINPSWDGPIKQLLADADAWLCKRRTGTTRPHLMKQLSSQTVFSLFIQLHIFVWLVCHILTLLCRPMWEGALLEHRGGHTFSFSVQIRSSPVYNQWSGISTHPGERQYFASWWDLFCVM